MSPFFRPLIFVVPALAVCASLLGCGRAPMNYFAPSYQDRPDRLSRLVHCYTYWASVEVRDLRNEMVSVRSRIQSLPPFSPQMNLIAGFHSGYAESQSAEQWVQVDLGHSAKIDMVVLIPAYVRRDDVNVAGYGFPKRFRVEVSDDPSFETSRVIFKADQRDVVNPGKYPFLIDELSNVQGRFVRLTCTRLAMDGDHAFFALGELAVISGTRNIALWRPLTADSAVEATLRWSAEYLVDGVSALPLPTYRQLSPTDGYQSAPIEDDQGDIAVLIDLEQSHPIDEVRLIPALPLNRPDIPGWGFPTRFRVELLPSLDEPPTVIFENAEEIRFWTQGAFVIPTGSRSYFLARPPRSLAAKDPPWELPPEPIEARYVRIISLELDRRVRPSYFALAEVQVYADGTNVAADKPVEVRNGGAAYEPTSRWGERFLTDEYTSRRKLKELPAWLTELDELRRAEAQLARANQAYAAAVSKVWSLNLWSAAAALCASLFWAMAFNYQLRRRHRTIADGLRKQIASDLHDDIGSNLGTIGLLCESVNRSHLTESEQQSLNEIREIAVETGDAMRDILWIIDPSSTRLEDFVGRLRQIANRLLPTKTVLFESPASIPTAEITLAWRRNVFLSIKEILHNAAKHSRAETVSIQVVLPPGEFQMRIRDDGVGFDPVARAASGFGLRNIARRLEELGGAVEYESTKNEGTTVQIRAPLPVILRGGNKS